MTTSRFRLRREGLVCLLLLTACLWAYWPVKGFGFLNYDDPDYVTQNREVYQGLSWSGVVWAFKTFDSSNWHPLTWLSLMLDCQLFGTKAGALHLINLGYHCLNALLLFGLFRCLTGAVWRSGFVAGLFALHPLHVESVAWIAERKDVLSTFFGLLSLWAYARYVKAGEHGSRPNPTHAGPSNPSLPSPAAGTWLRRCASSRATCYLLALFLFALGLMSKPMLVTLPGVMLLLDYWPLGRLPLQPHAGKAKRALLLLGEKAPFLLLSGCSCLLTLWAQQSGGSVVGTTLVPIKMRLANAALACTGYLQKMLWPRALAVFYPYPTVLASSQLAGALVTLLLLSLAVWWWGRRAPYLRMGWLWYLGTLVPVLGLVQVGGQSMADRYTYLPLLGIFVLLVWGACDLLARVPRPALLAAGLGGATLLACGATTRHQVLYWHDSETLFRHALEVAPQNNLIARINLGQALCERNDLSGAAAQFRETVRLEPRMALGQLDLANCLALGMHLQEALPYYGAALRLQPDNARAYKGLASTLALMGRLEDARTNLLAALRYKPDYAEAHTLLGNILLLEGAPEQALQHLQQAVRIQPDDAEAQYYLAGALARQGRFREAATAFRAALKANPRYAKALNDLAWMLATSRDQALRNVPEALHDAQSACTLTAFTNASFLDTLAVAQGEAGHLPAAIRLTQQALALAASANNAVLTEQLRYRLAAFEAGRSYSQAHEQSTGSP